MRTLVAVVPSLLMAGVLFAGVLAGCSRTSEDSGASSMAVQSPSSSPMPTPRATSKPPVPAGPPAADAPVAAVVAWVQAGAPVDVSGFRTATRDGTTIDLGDNVAFVTPSGTTQCRTDDTLTEGSLACLVKFTDPPAEPADLVGQWVGNWVDFDGASAQAGSVHGDPGPFSEGIGAELAYGNAVKFGDYQCRTDPTGLFCVNFARQSALQMSAAGVTAFGCLQQVTPPTDVGLRYECF